MISQLLIGFIEKVKKAPRDKAWESIQAVQKKRKICQKLNFYFSNDSLQESKKHDIKLNPKNVFFSFTGKRTVARTAAASSDIAGAARAIAHSRVAQGLGSRMVSRGGLAVGPSVLPVEGSKRRARTDRGATSRLGSRSSRAVATRRAPRLSALRPSALVRSQAHWTARVRLHFTGNCQPRGNDTSSVDWPTSYGDLDGRRATSLPTDSAAAIVQ